MLLSLNVQSPLLENEFLSAHKVVLIHLSNDQTDCALVPFALLLSVSLELFSLCLIGFLRSKELFSLLIKLEFGIFNSEFFFSELLASFLNISCQHPVSKTALDKVKLVPPES